MDIEPENI